MARRRGGEFLIEQGRLVDHNVEGVVVKGSGHWLMEEAPDQVTPALVAFLNKLAPHGALRDRLPPMRSCGFQRVDRRDFPALVVNVCMTNGPFVYTQSVHAVVQRNRIA